MNFPLNSIECEFFKGKIKKNIKKSFFIYLFQSKNIDEKISQIYYNALVLKIIIYV